MGFKSVFAVTASPAIYSGEEHFEVCDLYRLKNIPVPQYLTWEKTRIVLPFDHEEKRPDFVEEYTTGVEAFRRISERLRKLEMSTLLFTRNLKEIKWKTPHDKGHYLRDDYDINEISNALKTRKTDISDGNSVYSYIFFVRPITWNKESYKPVEIAFLVQNKSILTTKKPLFVLFPTTVETHMGFIINGPFRTPAHRETVSQEDEFNRFLVGQISQLLYESLIAIKDLGYMSINVLNTLPIRTEDFPPEHLLSPVFLAVRQILRTESLLPTDDGICVPAHRAKLARGDDLRKLLGNVQLTSLFLSRDGDTKWLPSNITIFDDLRAYITKELGVEEVRPQRVANLLSKDFLESQSDNWIIQFYRFLVKVPDLWEKQGSVLRQKEIIRLEDGSHVVPFGSDGRRNAYLPPINSVGTGFPTVRSAISNDTQAVDFLKRIGLTEPDMFAEVIDFVLLKYTNNNVVVNRQDNINDLLKIFRTFETSPSNRTSDKGVLLAHMIVLLAKIGIDMSISELQQSPTDTVALLRDVFYPLALGNISFIWAKNIMDEEKYCRATEVYMDNPDLRSYFSGNRGGWFVSEDYPEELKVLFLKLKIPTEPRVTRKNKDEKTGFVPIFDKNAFHYRGLDGFDPNIKVDGLEHALINPTLEKIRYIWNNIAVKHSDCIRGSTEFSRRATYETSKVKQQVSAQFGRLLLDSSWLPGLNGGFVNTKSLALEDLPESFHRDEKLAKQLHMKQKKENIIAKLLEEAGISQDTINLAQRLEGLSSNDKKEIERILNRARKPQSEFPAQRAIDLERREDKIEKELEDAPEKQYEKKEISLRTTKGSIDPDELLRNYYTMDGRMYCQICRMVMPFKKRNGEYYFERIEALSRDYFPKEHESQYLALCPVCAAMYKEFVKAEKKVMDILKEFILNSEESEIPLQLGELKTTLSIEKAHRQDLRVIIQSYDDKED